MRILKGIGVKTYQRFLRILTYNIMIAVISLVMDLKPEEKQ